MVAAFIAAITPTVAATTRAAAGAVMKVTLSWRAICLQSDKIANYLQIKTAKHCWGLAFSFPFKMPSKSNIKLLGGFMVPLWSLATEMRKHHVKIGCVK